MTYTKQTLQQDLAAMGLTGTETILIHSAMKSIGAVEGGADTVLDALMEFFAEGLLLLPTHTWQSIDQDHPVFDVRQAVPAAWASCRNCSGQRPGVVRSLHPTHSIAACGRGRSRISGRGTGKQHPLHPGGCYDRLRAVGGKILLLWQSAMPGTPSFTAWRRC